MATCSNAACRETRWRGGDLANRSKHNDPNGGVVFNVAKETTATELCSIEGLTEHTRRMQGINLSSGATNAVEFAVACFGLPDYEQLLKTYDEENNIEA